MFIKFLFILSLILTTSSEGDSRHLAEQYSTLTQSNLVSLDELTVSDVEFDDTYVFNSSEFTASVNSSAYQAPYCRPFLGLPYFSSGLPRAPPQSFS